MEMAMKEFLELAKHVVCRRYGKEGRYEEFLGIKKTVKGEFRADGRTFSSADGLSDTETDGQIYTDTDVFREAQSRLPFLGSGIEPNESISTTIQGDTIQHDVTTAEMQMPLDSDSTKTFTLSDKELDDLSQKSGTSNFDADFQWAYDNVGKRTIDIKDSPSSAAYFFWEFFSRSPAKFFDVAAKVHLAKTKNVADDDKAMQDDKRKKFALIEALQEPVTCRHCGGEI